ncbi:hypothetical protein OKA04_23335 [Luteolibacter flavescens]|uniref:Uncharacterized protein n=1 Tax=Luteolibacter flavescens TaxID=1859460 RepID=A0ABT3FVT3_9BACT|nr:hypothetical protein [Luteolibacter flavescens]MCW1887690.1 hypothetical protein [Luteolibacter flavescens]
MIHTIYQTPPVCFGYPDTPPDEQAPAFIGQHTGHLPKPGDTFARYGEHWTITESTTTGKAPWTFRARATAVAAPAPIPAP